MDAPSMANVLVLAARRPVDTAPTPLPLASAQNFACTDLSRLFSLAFMHEIRHFLDKRVSVIRQLDSRLETVSTSLNSMEHLVTEDPPHKVLQEELEEAIDIHSSLSAAHVTAAATISKTTIKLEFMSGRRPPSDPVVLTISDMSRVNAGCVGFI